MDRASLKEHFGELRAGLLQLRALLDGDRRAQNVFEEFVEHNEFELALHTLCDTLLDRDAVSIKDSQMIAIQHLHEKMQIDDGCVAGLKKRVKRAL